MGRSERRKADKSERFQVRRATIGEARDTRAFIAAAFKDRISWVASRSILAMIVAEAEPGPTPDTVVVTVGSLHRAMRFLEVHPPEPVPSISKTAPGAEKVEAKE